MKRSTSVGLHPERQRETAMRAFVELIGLSEALHRATEIEALPRAHWKGRELYTIRCHGERGKGPHDVNVTEALLWALLDIRAYRCPFHA